LTCTVAIYSINDMYVFLGRQMYNGHFKCPLDPVDHWTLYPFNISTMPFPGGCKVRFSPLDPIDTQISNGHSIWALDMHMSNGHLSCLLNPMSSHMSNGHFICPLDICVIVLDMLYVHMAYICSQRQSIKYKHNWLFKRCILK
jgi:hypothetical protein